VAAFALLPHEVSAKSKATPFAHRAASWGIAPIRCSRLTSMRPRSAH